MSNVVSRRVISNSRSTVGFEQTRTIRPRWRVTRRSPLSRTLKPVESMNSVGVRSSTRPVLPRAIAASRRRLNSGAVLTWISPVTVITCVWSSTSSSSSWKSGSVNATCLAYLNAGGEVNADGRFLTILFPHRASGGGGIRTRGPRERTPVFKTGAFDLSATPPGSDTVPPGSGRLALLQREADTEARSAVVRSLDVHLRRERADDGEPEARAG